MPRRSNPLAGLAGLTVGLGANGDATDTNAMVRQGAFTAGLVYATIVGAIALGTSVAGAFHGYRRGGLGSAVGYALFGLVMPQGAITTMLVQGYGK